VNFPEQPPSTRWAALTFRGAKLAEVWFKPEYDPSAVLFRVPRATFDLAGVGPRLTADSLLKAVGLPAGGVEAVLVGADPGPELLEPLPRPDADHLEVLVRLKPPETDATDGPETAAGWDDLDAVWKSVLTIEAAVEAARKMVEGVKAEVESAARRSLAGDDKVYALAGDVAQWNQAKSRAHYALPKAADFIHRATWAATAAERKRLGEVFDAPGDGRPAVPPGGHLLRELESLRKSRQVLAAQGTAVYQECRAIAADVQGALRRLQANAAARAAQKKGGAGRKGKSF
jgi:hypothetical protein